jgi:hypothetical protein
LGNAEPVIGRLMSCTRRHYEMIPGGEDLKFSTSRGEARGSYVRLMASLTFGGASDWHVFLPRTMSEGLGVVAISLTFSLYVYLESIHLLGNCSCHACSVRDYLWDSDGCTSHAYTSRQKKERKKQSARSVLLLWRPHILRAAVGICPGLLRGWKRKVRTAVKE